MAWYAYIGGNPNNPASYFLLAGQPIDCLNGFTICAILAPAGPGNFPANIPAALQAKIANALATGIAQPQPSPPLQLEVLVRN